MTELDEVDLHLWAEFNLPTELQHDGVVRPTPLGRSLARGRVRSSRVSTAEARRELESEPQLSVRRFRLA